MQLSLRTDRPLLRSSAESVRYIMISIVAPVAPPRDGRLPANVGIVLDRSGSMDGARKFDLARDAVEHSLRMLRPDDHFTLVVYDHAVDTLVPTTLATTESKTLAMNRLADVGPRGSTDLCAGWMTGATEMQKESPTGSVNRVMLITDGLANHGITEPSELVSAAADLRQRGIATSTFGVGEDFDEVLLRDLAHEGGGNFYFIETPAMIPDLLTSELGEALEVVRRNAVLQIALPPGARAELLNRYRVTHAAGDNEISIALGDITSAQQLQVVVRVQFPRGEPDTVTSIRAGLAGDDALTLDAEQEIAWRYAGDAENDAQPRDRVVDHEVAALYAARARAEATEANRAGDFRRARKVLEATARRILSYAHRDRVLERIARELLDSLDVYAGERMSAMSLKASLYVAESAARNRSPEGKARRREP